MKRNILNYIFAILVFGVVSCGATQYKEVSQEPDINYGGLRPAGQENVLQLAVDPIPTVRIAIIGTGNRGSKASRRFTFMHGVEIKAICDIKEDALKKTREIITGRNFPPADEYLGEEAWRKVVERNDIDLVYITTNWRTPFYEDYTGNPYPTHGLGPVCQALNIHRGDKMNYLVSVSSDQFGMTQYLEDTFGKDSERAKKEYKMGDMNTTIIKKEKGKTIMIQHDVTSPRPYSRLHTLSGTKGFAQKYPTPGIALEPNAHNFLNKEEYDKLIKKYEHPFITEVGEFAKKVGGHGGMDFIMDYRLIYCLQHGLPLDIDVYDAAEWSCLVELTEISASNGGMPVRIPDFTRGDWDQLDGLKFAK